MICFIDNHLTQSQGPIILGSKCYGFGIKGLKNGHYPYCQLSFADCQLLIINHKSTIINHQSREVSRMKKFCLVLSLVLFVVVLYGCYTAPPPPPPFTIEVKADKEVYHIGEMVIFAVRASQSCYLTLYDISTKGEVTQIFPNRYAQDNWIQGGTVYRIPDKQDSFDFEITGPPGMERVRAIGTLENVNFFESRKIDATEPFPRILQKPDQFDHSVSQKLDTIPRENWTEASITFQVVP